MTEPKDMAAVRRIIWWWERPYEVSTETYILGRTKWHSNSRDTLVVPSLDKFLVTETPPVGRDL